MGGIIEFYDGVIGCRIDVQSFELRVKGLQRVENVGRELNFACE